MRKALSFEAAAACAVRTFASTATRIPMKPAASEQKAPTTNPIAVRGSLKTHSKMKMTTAITLIVLTCRFRYALAPSCIAAAISSIR